MSDIVQKAIADEQRERKMMEVYHRKASAIQGDMTITVELETHEHSLFRDKWKVYISVYQANTNSLSSGFRMKSFWRPKSATRFFERIVRDHAMKEVD